MTAPAPEPRVVHVMNPQADEARADRASEMAVLGWLIDGRAPASAVSEVWTLLDPEDFYLPVHGALARICMHLHAQGQQVDPARVLHEINAAGLMRLMGQKGGGYLGDLLHYAAVGNVLWHVGKIVDSARERDIVRLLTQGLQRLEQPGVDLLHFLAEHEDEVHALKVTASASVDLGLVDLEDFMAQEDEPVEFVLDGLLGRREKCVWTGSEGLGKSTLMRQLALCAAAGLHPFTREYAEPRRVLWLDKENHPDANRRLMRPVWEACAQQGRPIQRGVMKLEHLRGGFSLMSDRDVSWLTRAVTEHRPDLVYIGPLYKILGGSSSDEMVMSKAIDVLDRLCDDANCALLMEAHAGHGKDGDGKRDWRPRGSSALLGWPDFGFGIGLSEDPQAEVSRLVDVKPWRGVRHMNRQWPTQMAAGGRWSWDVW